MRRDEFPKILCHLYPLRGDRYLRYRLLVKKKAYLQRYREYANGERNLYTEGAQPQAFTTFRRTS